LRPEKARTRQRVERIVMAARLAPQINLNQSEEI
jgi:hypothetical protein